MEIREKISFEDYMCQLRKWKLSCEVQKWICSNHYFTLNNSIYQSQLGHPISTYETPQQTSIRLNSSHTSNQPVQQNNQPIVFKIPSLKRRLAAEFTDFILLFTLKMIVLWLLSITIGLSTVNLTLHVLWLDEINLDQFEELHQDELETMLVLAFVYRTNVCLYEWLFVWYQGATPGKRIFKLKVVSCFTILGRNEVTIIPATSLSCTSAWTRSLVKNLAIAFMIPSFITALFYSHRRTSYDIIAKSIVVSED